MLRRLELEASNPDLAQLAHPRLERLSIGGTFGHALSATRAPSLFAAKLPRLRWLRLVTRPALQGTFIDALLDSTLLRQLERLDFEDASNASRTLDDAGLLRLLHGKARLAHLRALWLELAGRRLEAKDLEAARAAFRRRIDAAMKEDARERKQDEAWAEVRG